MEDLGPYFASKSERGRVVSGGGPPSYCIQGGPACGKRIWTPLGIVVGLCDSHLRERYPVYSMQIRDAIKSGAFRFRASERRSLEVLRHELRESLANARLLPPDLAE